MKKIQKSLLIMAMSAVASFAAIGGSVFSSHENVLAESVSVEYSLIFDYYTIKDYDSNAYAVVSPSGNDVNVEEDGDFLLSELGRYTVYKNNEIAFYVEAKAYDVAEKAENLFSGANITSIKASTDWSAQNSNSKPGIEIAMSGTNSAFWYHNVIDLEKLSAEDIVFGAYAERSDRSNMNDLKISMIDVNDPNNVVSVTFKQSQEMDTCTYLTVQFNNYSLALPNQGTLTTVRETGSVVMRTSFKTNEVRDSLAFTYDCEEKAFYQVNGAAKLVMDLDDDTLLQGRTPFAGFSDNKVYLKVETTASNSCILLQQIAGKAVSDLDALTEKNNNFLRTYYDGGFYSGNILNDGLINVEYKLPELYYDYQFDKSITADWKLLYLQDEKWLDITDSVENGAFTPNALGWYKMVYTANGDTVGKIQKEQFFEVFSSVAPIAIENTDSAAPILSEFKPPVIQASGGSGKLKIDVVYKYNGQIVELDKNGFIVLDRAGALTMEICVVDFLGQTEEKIITIDVIEAPIVTVEEIPVSFYAGREYILPDFTAINYLLPETDTGYNMSKTIRVNGVEIGADRKFTPSADAATVIIEYIGGLGTEYETIEVLEIPVLSISDSEQFPISDYFIRDNVEMSLFDSGVRCDFSDDGSFELPNAVLTENFNFSITFLDKEDVAEYPGEHFLHTWYRFEAVEIVFTDYADVNKTVTLRLDSFRSLWLNDIGTTAGKLPLTVNGLYKTEVKYSRARYDSTLAYAGINYYTFSLSMHSYDKVLSNGSGSLLSKINYYDNGRIFEGFTNGLARVTFRFVNVNQDCAVVIQGLGNQALNEYALYDGDEQGPLVGLNGVKPTAKYNESVVIPAVQAYDIFQGKSTVTECVLRKPDKTKVVLDGSVANTVKFDQYGSYLFEYTAVDTLGNEGYYSFSIKVEDEQSPTIQCAENYKVQYFVGDALVLPTYQTNDNVAVKSNQVFIREPSAKMLLVSSEYIFKSAGEYEVFIMASDVNGNIATKQYTVTVKEK